ncbi:hypothetical protein GCM10027080_39710 [Pedococcus soli]
MLRTPMPEAAVDKDSESLLGEGHIDTSAQNARHREVHSISEASGIKEAAKYQLRRRILALLALETTAHLLRRG